MKSTEYIVYEIVKGKRHIIACCEEYADARVIAIALATVDPKGDEYSVILAEKVTSIEKGNVFIPGGGWVDTYKRNLKTGQVEERNLG